LSDGPLFHTRTGLRLLIRLSPRAKADRLNGVVAAPGGGSVLAAMVKAAPEGGRANEALLRLLARAWRLSRRDLSIAGGSASRNKTVNIAGDPQRLFDRLAALIALDQ
jgi:uncharacterized protein YggU (UPF0235/DUF167 family)